MDSISSNNQRIEMRMDLETRQMTERGSATLGCSSLTEYITRWIRRIPSVSSNSKQILNSVISNLNSSLSFVWMSH